MSAARDSATTGPSGISTRPARVDAVLAELAALDAVGSAVDLSRFRAALASALDAPGPHAGRFGTGVFVGPLHAAFGAAFEVVTILGGTEGTLPPHGREDPFLTDADRTAAGMPTSADRAPRIAATTPRRWSAPTR